MIRTVSIQNESRVPKYLQISQQLALQISEGQLLPGERLPSIRALSRELGLNQITIVKAYEQLEREKLVCKRPGSGVFVDTSAPQEEPLPERQEHLFDELYGQEEIRLLRRGQIHIPEGSINLATSTPSQEIFPLKEMKRAITTVLETDRAAAFEYASSNGYGPLREQLSQICKEHYRMDHSADQIQIISGAQQGIDITSKAILSPGDVIMTEEITYPGALEVFRSRGARIVGMRMETEGPDIAHLESSIRYYKPRALYVSPSYQNPTGSLWCEEKKVEVLRLCEEHGVYIIEDDYISDLHFTPTWPKALKWYDQSKRGIVIYIKSFSKIVMPGLRMAMLIAPDHLYQRILKAKQFTDIASSALIQRSMHLYFLSGAWKEHLERIRVLYARRLEVALKSIAHYLPWAEVVPVPTGGVHMRLKLPEGVKDTDLYSHAAAAGVLITPGSLFWVNSTREFDWIRLSTAASDLEQISEGIRRLALAFLPLWQRPGSGNTLPLI